MLENIKKAEEVKVVEETRANIWQIIYYYHCPHCGMSDKKELLDTNPVVKCWFCKREFKVITEDKKES
jgi:hypothetical protein